jgi:hypothetical protein
MDRFRRICWRDHVPLHIYADEIGRDARGDLQGLISADFEAEVEDAIESIFRHGDVSFYELLKNAL